MGTEIANEGVRTNPAHKQLARQWSPNPPTTRVLVEHVEKTGTSMEERFSTRLLDSMIARLPPATLAQPCLQ